MPDRAGRPAQVSERAPARCPAGHRLGPHRMVVGWHPCGCAGGRGHRTWTCSTCGQISYAPPHRTGTGTAGDLGLAPPDRA